MTLARRRLLFLAMIAVPLIGRWADAMIQTGDRSVGARGCFSLYLVGLTIAGFVYDDRFFFRPLRRAEKALALSAERYRHLIDESRDLLLMIRSNERGYLDIARRGACVWIFISGGAEVIAA